MATLWMEFGNDFNLNSQGGLLMANGFDETRQYLERVAFTTSLTTLPDGSLAPAEYYLDQSFGESLRLKVGTLATPQAAAELQRGLRVAAASAPGVDQSQPVQFTQKQVGNIVYVTITIPLNNGKSQTLTYSVGGTS